MVSAVERRPPQAGDAAREAVSLRVVGTGVRDDGVGVYLGLLGRGWAGQGVEAAHALGAALFPARVSVVGGTDRGARGEVWVCHLRHRGYSVKRTADKERNRDSRVRKSTRKWSCGVGLARRWYH